MSGLIEVQLLNGIVQGMIYALVAAGLTLIFGMLDIPNFAHRHFELEFTVGRVSWRAAGNERTS